MELQDLSSGEEYDCTPVVAFDEVVPFTPPSPETPRRAEEPVQAKPRKPKNKSNRQRTSKANEGKFVELESDEEHDEAYLRSHRSKPIQVKPRKPSPEDIDDEVFMPQKEERRTSEERPKSKSKHKRKSKKEKAAKEDAKKQEEKVWPGDLKGIFDIDGTTSDVILDRLGLSWSHVAMGISISKKKSKKKEKDSSENESQLKYEDIIGLKIKRQRKGKQVEGEGVCLGIAVQTYERKENGRLKEKMITFGNPSQDICMEWSRRIQSVIEGFDARPKNLLVFIQPFAGKRNSRSIYNKHIAPLLELAGIKDERIDVNHNEHIKQEMIHVDLKKYDCIVCVGGDGTVSKVVSHMMTKIQKDNHIDMRSSFQPVKAPLPIGIIPVGTFNQICHTVQGVEDPITAAIHIILGHTYPSDICSTYCEEKFHGWGFNCHYGFFGSVLPFVPRYARLGDKKLEASFMKALTKAKFRSYECEIQYIPYEAEKNHHPKNNEKCRQGCSRCSPDQSDNNHNAPTLDEVQTLPPLDESGNSSTLIDLSKNSPWQLAKDDYASVSVLSTPALSDLAPHGMSKFTHVADGFMDLILVKSVDKKEFLRYLKRHGNQKDQLNLPFVEAIRCTEVRFHARSADSWNHKDYSVNEILDEVKKGETKIKRGLHRAESIEVIDDLDEDLEDSDSDSEIEQEILDFMPTKNTEKSGSTKKSKEKQREKSKQKKAKSKEQSTDVFCVDGGNNNMGYVNENFDEGSAGSRRTPQEKLAQDTNLVMHVTPKYRPSLIEQEHARRMKSQRKHAEKKKAKSESKQKSIWNIDNEAVTELDLHFRIHKGLIRLCGQGVPAQYDPDEVKMGCLAIF